MNKKELVECIAEAATIGKTDAEKALNGTLKAIADCLKKGDKVTLVGFGTFSVSKRDARQGRNPQTGDTITIPARLLLGLRPEANCPKKSISSPVFMNSRHTATIDWVFVE